MATFRQRKSSRSKTAIDSKVEENSTVSVMPLDAGLSYKSLEKEKPSHQGSVLKLHIPLFYSLLPSFLQRILYNCPCCKLRPIWKERKLIIIGNYLYRFSNYDLLKGKPLSLSETDTHLVTKQSDYPSSSSVLCNDDFGELRLDNLPVYYCGIFCITSNGKTRYYAAQTHEEAIAWVNSIRQSRQECIKRKMGHAEHVPYPRPWNNFDRIADKIIRKKKLMKARMNRLEREMEMEMTSCGHIQPNGYYN